MDTAVVALIILLILGTGIIWLSNKKGSFAWNWKNSLFGEISAEAKGRENPNIVQKQEGGEDNLQSAAKEATSYQEQKEGKGNIQEIK